MGLDAIAELYGEDLAPAIMDEAADFWLLYLFWDAYLAKQRDGEGFDKDELAELAEVREQAERLV
jgi:hypothetical protein